MFELVLKQCDDMAPKDIETVKENIEVWETEYNNLLWDLENRNIQYKDDRIFGGPWVETKELKYDYINILKNIQFSPSEISLILEANLRIADRIQKGSQFLYINAIRNRMDVKKQIANSEETLADNLKIAFAENYFHSDLKSILIPAIERGVIENNMLCEGRDDLIIFKTSYYEKTNQFVIDSLTDDNLMFLKMLTSRLATLSQTSFYTASTAFATTSPVITDVNKYEDFWTEALDIIWETRTKDLNERELIVDEVIEKICNLYERTTLDELYLSLFNELYSSTEELDETDISENEAEEEENDLGGDEEEEIPSEKPASFAIRLDKETYKETKALTKAEANKRKNLKETKKSVKSKWDKETHTSERHVQILEDQGKLPPYNGSNIHDGVSISAVSYYDNHSTSTYSRTGQYLLEDMAKVKKLARTISRSFEKLFYDKEKRKVITGLETGAFNGNEAYRIYTDQRPFMKKMPKPKRNDLGFYILMDESGSMGSGRGSTLYNTMMASYAIASCCQKLSIPCGVMGHTTSYSGVELHLYKSMAKKGNINNIFCAECCNSNRDGLALFKAAELFHKESKNKDKILFIISDGQPADRGYWDKPAEQDIISVVKFAKKVWHINVIGVGVGESAEYVKNIYPDWIYVSQPSELGEKLGQKVKEKLLKTR